jgi:uncharacterized OsmC-like protein
MSDIDSAIDSPSDVVGDERIQPIFVKTEYVSRYQSVSTIRDLPPLYIDEPEDLGGSNAGPTALESTLAALNSCTAMIMYVMKRELRFDLGAVRFETEGWIDVRRIEMKRKKIKYSEVEPIAYHYQKVTQKVFIETSETAERLAHFKSEVERLCPLNALLHDAKVPMESEWVLLPASPSA